MKRGDLIFVYGTLRKGERADLSKGQGAFNVMFVGEDDINGTMYHLGAYPGVKASPGEFNPDLPTVHGEIFLARSASITAILDAYEGYPTLYDRCQTGTRQGRSVWVYTYPHPVREEQRIPGGDWVRNREILVRNRI